MNFLQWYKLKSTIPKCWWIAVCNILSLNSHTKLLYDLLMKRKINLCRFIYQYKSNIYCNTLVEIVLHWKSFLQCIETD